MATQTKPQLFMPTYKSPVPSRLLQGASCPSYLQTGLRWDLSFSSTSIRVTATFWIEFLLSIRKDSHFTDFRNTQIKKNYIVLPFLLYVTDFLELHVFYILKGNQRLDQNLQAEFEQFESKAALFPIALLCS